MTNSEKRPPKYEAIYEEFVLWSATPPSERIKLGIETQQQFCEYYQISINTPTAWKRRRDFAPRVSELRREWAFGKTSGVIEGIYRSSLKGNPMSQKLWMQIFEGFSEKTEQTQKMQTELRPSDIRFLIDILPEPQRIKFNGYLDEIVAVVETFKRKDPDNPEWHVRRPLDYENEWDSRQTLPEKSPFFIQRVPSADLCDPQALRRAMAGPVGAAAHDVPSKDLSIAAPSAGSAR